MEEGFLHDVFGLPGVANYAASDAEDQTGVTVEQNFEGYRVIGLQTGHYFFIGGETRLGRRRGRSGSRFRRGSPGERECEGAARRGSAHVTTLDGCWIAEACSGTPLATPERSQRSENCWVDDTPGFAG